MRDFDAVSVRVSEFDTREIVVPHVFHYRDLLSPEPVSPVFDFSRGSDSEAEVDLWEPMVFVVEHQEVLSCRDVCDAFVA